MSRSLIHRLLMLGLLLLGPGIYAYLQTTLFADPTHQPGADEGQSAEPKVPLPHYEVPEKGVPLHVDGYPDRVRLLRE